MKRLFLLPLASFLCMIVILSCDKDDPAATNQLVGTWKFVSFTSSNCTDPGDNGTETCTGGVADCGSLTLTETTFTYTPPTGGGTPESGTYTVSGSTIISTPTGGTADDPVTFAVSGTTLTLTSVDATSGCTEVTVLQKQ